MLSYHDLHRKLHQCVQEKSSAQPFSFFSSSNEGHSSSTSHVFGNTGILEQIQEEQQSQKEIDVSEINSELAKEPEQSTKKSCRLQ